MPRKKKAPPRTKPPPDPAREDALIPDFAPVAPLESKPPPPQTPRALSYAEADKVRRLLVLLRLRKIEALRLYEPLPLVEKDFHASRADERLLRGSNRAGKTLAAAAEVARAVTGQDPHAKFPARDGLVIAVGLDEEHCGSVMFKKLCRPGAFWIIRDEASAEWRVYNPNTDKARQHERRPAPPLIAKRFITDVGWKDKKKGIPSILKLTTGWTIHFFSSKAMPPQGWAVNLWWIDEECENELWYTELSARVLDFQASGFWSATPQVANPQLYDLHLKAQDERLKERPLVTECVTLLSDNPYIEQGDKDKFAAKLSPEERRVRIDGEFRLSGFKIYPEFSMDLHGIYEASWRPPAGWCHYLAVDPGRQVCACLFLAVPPPAAAKDIVVLYDELYIKGCDADTFGARVAAHKIEHVTFERILIDSHAGRVTEMGSGISVDEHYRRALKKYDIQTKLGFNFVPGHDDPKAGIEAVRAWLRDRDPAGPKLRVVHGRLPQFEWEIGRYHFKRQKQLVTDEPEKRNDHLMDCVRYLAALGPRWAKPKAAVKPKSSAVVALGRKKRKAAEKRDRQAGVRLGPAGRVA